MFFIALATDYDGTIATDGQVPAEVSEGLRKFKTSGRKLILVTGRELDDLKRVYPEHTLFDRIVAENGAVLYTPQTQTEKALAPPPPEAFVHALKSAGVDPLSVGRVIVATWEPNKGKVLDVIKAQGLELQIIFNKGAVMVLPAGINKASGLSAALDDLGLAAANVVGAGDAENDHAFLKLCGCSAAVANALDAVKEDADLIMDAPRGAGVLALMDRVCRSDAAVLPVSRHGITLGAQAGQTIFLPTGQGNILIAGHSAVGKSTIATALTERMTEQRLQFCVLDPEGDFETLTDAVQVGTAKLAPSMTETANLLKRTDTNIVVNALAVALEERPAFFAQFLAAVSASRIATARPHWLIVDEAHHVLPQDSETATMALPHDLSGTIFITVHPEAIAKSALEKVKIVIAAGREAGETLAAFAQKLQVLAPTDAVTCDERSVLVWDRQSPSPPSCLVPTVPAQVRRRHTRKYAEGELGRDKSFYFKGPEGTLNLRAANLLSFLNIADGVDDATWEYHRKEAGYSTWISGAIKDEEMADAVAAIEQDGTLNAKASRDAIRGEIEKRYTAPSHIA